MDAALPQYDGDGGDDAFHNPMFKDEEYCTVDAPIPPRGADGRGDTGDGDGDADKPARSPTLRARVALAIGLVFEVSATLWAFGQAVSAGALDGDVECTYDGRLSKLYGSYVVMDRCDGQVEADVFYNLTASLENSSYSYFLKEYVVCENLTDALAGAQSFQKLCRCEDDFVPFEVMSCSWVALSSPWDDICFAQALRTNSSNGTVIGGLHTHSFTDSCWATNPTGTMELTITALVVALISQLLEAFVGFKYWKDTDKRTVAFTLAVSVFEALGVVAVTWVLLTLPGFYWGAVFFWLALAIVPLVVVGALVEITAEYSDRAASRLPYLGAVGNGFIWLGAALLEVTVTSYVLWEGAGMTNLAELALETAGLFVLELLGLVSMWIARGLWTRAMLLSAPTLKRLERSLSERASSTRSRFERCLSKRTISTYFK